MSRRPILSALTLALAACAGAPRMPSVSMAEWTRQTDQHKRIVAVAGEWEGTLTVIEPDLPGSSFPAKETVEALGPYWVQTRFSCDLSGTPYVGTGCVGYDPATGKYLGTWIDSTSSYFARMEGELEPSGKLVMRWKAPDERTGELVARRSESVETPQGRVMTFYKGTGAGTKSMVIEMKRKSS